MQERHDIISLSHKHTHGVSLNSPNASALKADKGKGRRWGWRCDAAWAEGSRHTHRVTVAAAAHVQHSQHVKEEGFLTTAAARSPNSQQVLVHRELQGDGHVVSAGDTGG